MSIRRYCELVDIKKENVWEKLAGYASVQGFRSSMEDAHVLADVGHNTRLLAVFDGHGGSRVSDLAARVLKARVEEQWPSSPKAIPASAEAVRRALLSVENELGEENSRLKSVEHTGSTAACVTIDPQQISSCWLGDTRAVIAAHDGTSVPLSFDHKPTAAIERQRIFQNGGTVFRGRVNGALAVSRALGDYCYKSKINPLVSATPDCLIRSRHPRDEFLILACDGIWEKVSNDQATALVRAARSEYLTPAEMAAKLVRWALLAGSSDNVTVLVHILNVGKEDIICPDTAIMSLKDVGLSTACLRAHLVLDRRSRDLIHYTESQVISLFSELGFSEDVFSNLAEHHLDGAALLETTEQEFIEDIQMLPLDAAFMAAAIRWWEKTATWI